MTMPHSGVTKQRPLLEPEAAKVRGGAYGHLLCPQAFMPFVAHGSIAEGKTWNERRRLDRSRVWHGGRSEQSTRGGTRRKNLSLL